MVEQFSIAGIEVVVTFKDIKNVHLSVNPPSGAVRIAAPTRMNLDTIRVFAISKLAWIKRQQKKFQDQEREPSREFVERESHYVWGKRYLLKIEETDFTPQVEFRHHRLALRIRPDTDISTRQALVDAFYRRQIRSKVGPMIAEWAE